MKMSKEEENKLNDAGDRMAVLLRMKREDHLDTQGRIRWETTEGFKTGIGLIRTLTHFITLEVHRTRRA
jgi:hypothetical protein